MPAALVSDEMSNLLPGSEIAIFLPFAHTAEGDRVLYGASFVKALIPFMRAPPT